MRNGRALVGRGRSYANPSGGSEGSAVLLQTRSTQTGKAVTVDRPLPGQELFRSQSITLQRILEREQPAAHRRDHLGLAADDPTAGFRRGQIVQRQRRTRGADNIGLSAAVRARLLLLQHGFTPFPPSLLKGKIRQGP